MIDPSSPPAYAWDWFSRQRLLWRESRSRLAHAASPVAGRYRAATSKSEAVPLLREDYLADPTVRDVVQRVVADLAFLGRTDVPFAQLGVRNPPRGMRWWWTALTGEPVGNERPEPPRMPAQLSLDDVHEGYGG